MEGQSHSSSTSSPILFPFLPRLRSCHFEGKRDRIPRRRTHASTQREIAPLPRRRRRPSRLFTFCFPLEMCLFTPPVGSVSVSLFQVGQRARSPPSLNSHQVVYTFMTIDDPACSAIHFYWNKRRSCDADREHLPSSRTQGPFRLDPEKRWRCDKLVVQRDLTLCFPRVHFLKW